MSANSKRRARLTGRGAGGAFLALPHAWLDSPQWAALDAFEVKLIIDLAAQYTGKNNGDLCAAWTLMQPRGWRSSATLNKTLRSLQQKGWVVLTRQGGRHLASLYALTFWGIDACGGKLDIAANPVPLNNWKNSFGSRLMMQCSRDVMQSDQKITRKAA